MYCYVQNFKNLQCPNFSFLILIFLYFFQQPLFLIILNFFTNPNFHLWFLLLFFYLMFVLFNSLLKFYFSSKFIKFFSLVKLPNHFINLNFYMMIFLILVHWQILHFVIFHQLLSIFFVQNPKLIFHLIYLIFNLQVF